jgi:hypothetical protein
MRNGWKLPACFPMSVVIRFPLMRLFKWIRRFLALPHKTALAWDRIVELEKAQAQYRADLLALAAELAAGQDARMADIRKQLADLRAVIAARPGRPTAIVARSASVYRRLTENAEGEAYAPPGENNAA